MRLVIGAFTTLSEAESAARGLLDLGHDQERISAYGRAGGGRLLLAGRIAVHPVGDPARLVSRAERARAFAAVGAVTGAALAAAGLGVARLLGVDPLAIASPYLIGWTAFTAALVLSALAGAGLFALARRTDGLPHELAYRYGVRLDQGDTVIAIRTAPGAETHAAQELLGMHGAVIAHATRGAVEPLGAAPAGVSLAPSSN